MAGDRQGHAGKQHAKLQILVLHGSRQDGEVFSQRLKTLTKKLKNIAELHFVSAPHTLPLQEGQSVHMRAWWRHWNIGTEESPAGQPELEVQQQEQAGGAHNSSNNSGEPCTSQQQQPELASAASAGPPASASPFGTPSLQPSGPAQGDEQLPGPLVQQLQRQPSLLHGQARQEEILSMMASGWEAVVLRDWAVSLQHLTDIWTSAAQDFDGVLGFSNGAAAAFLFAAHAAAYPETFGSMRFVALAGGYVPEPLDKLLDPSLLAQTGNSNSNSSSSGDVQPVTRLKAPLPFASLHMMGSNDPLIEVDVATQLMECFQPQGRVQLVHDSGHCVPQQARFMQDILKFIVGFAEIALAPARPHHPRKQHTPAPTATAAGPPTEGAVAEIEAQLHRQGLREKVSKGPAKKHLLLHMDSAGQPHQHHDHLLSPRGSSHKQFRHRPQLQQQIDAQATSPHQPQAATQHSSTPLQASAAPAAVAAAAPVPAAAAAVAVAAGATALQGFGQATDLQLEELEALEAIFGTEYSQLSSCPPTFVIRLREPGSEEGSEAQLPPPSAHFSLKSKLPMGYPSSSDAQPQVDIEGPLGAKDPARSALQQHLSSSAAQQQQELGGEAGYIWQLVGAAKDWIDANIPPDVATRRAGQFAGAAGPSSAVPAACGGVEASNGVHAAAAGSGNNTASGGAGGLPWWEREDADLQLVARATAEAAAAHWASWSVNQEDNPWGSDEDDTTAAAASAAAAATAAVAASNGSSSAEALASAGDGVRGRWDYVIGLVGKPSAGKSTFFNAVTDPVNEEDAAREGAFPFTTITPNVGRGFIALPDPSPLLGLRPDQVQPAYGFAPGLDISRVAQAGFSDIKPLQQLVKDCGWQQQPQQQQQQETGSGPEQQQEVSSGHDRLGGDGILWRRVPVVVKDVAGLVPGAYQGRGRGNAFLSDLCDADVLVHVVDASGTTDSKGVAMAAGGPAGLQDNQQQQQQQQGQQGQHDDKASDAGGEDPIEEVSWVRRELHCWVYDNVRAKWATVLKRPSRLPQLFSGYHAPTGLVTAVLRAVGVRLEDLAAETAARGNAGLQGGTKEVGGPLSSSSLSSWGEWELHRLVAHFLAARFPILLALNKADLPSARSNIQSVLAAYPHHAAVAVSAAAERKLHQLRRQGLIQYEDAASTAQLHPDDHHGADSSSQLAAAATGVLQNIQQSVLGTYKTTGVLAALTCAVALKPPRWVFPIADRERCVALAAAPNRAGAGGSSGSSSRSKHGGAGASSLGWGVDAKARAAQGAEAGVLRDCVLLKPGSRVEDVFWVLKRPPYALLEGDFVRAECRVLQLQTLQPPDAKAAITAEGQQQGVQSKMRVVRKDELVGPANCVLLLQTNRKVSWQHGSRPS